MTLLEFLLLLLIAGVCGSIGQSIAGFSRGGCIISIVVGFIGALLGSWMSAQMGWPEILDIQVGNRSFPVVWSIIGAVVFTAIVGLLTKNKKF